MNYLLGIDVGTGGTRAVLTDRSGGIVSSATCEHVPFASPKIGWAEQDPYDWHRATGSAVRQAISAAGVNPIDISAVGREGLARECFGFVAGEHGHHGGGVVWHDYW
jgi:xylulokinase